MRDYDVRLALRQMLSEEHAGNNDTRIVEEMGIWSGSARIDLAVINGRLIGYELKSDSDTLDRLPAQAELYSRVFDEVCLVVGKRHARHARQIVPSWWGMIIAEGGTGGVELRRTRKGRTNPKPDTLLVARLLWRDEALEALESRGLAKGLRSKPAPELHQKLSTLPYQELSDLVRTALKRRVGWLRQTVGDQGQVPVNADFNPCLATS